MTRVFLAALLWMLAAAPALAVVFEGQAVQGGLVTGRAAPGTAIALDGRAVRVSAEGLFVLGFGRDHGPEAVLEILHPDGRAESRIVAVAPRDFDIQRIDGLPERKVTPRPEDAERIRAEAALVAAARTVDSETPSFAQGFRWPAIGRVSGVFGSQRILNGMPRAFHNGVDIAGPVGTPVTAAASGVVSLTHPDMFYNGMTVMIDHGHGLATIYVHLSEITVEDGQRVGIGQLIGRLGQTGRATGPHLHWGLSWFGTHLDPALVAGPMPKSD